ncbi:hypothetical protein SEA_ARCHIMEDES_49 [Gordonia phage Archimedes]|uniref:DUF2786 domain-containing protein n=1 Tax=Gordonia phage Archimedes TaxID=2759389 RepID=A0A7L7SSQ3_9CAUD|nr:hypothetical protein KCH38_gp49 [Gordonia phage Archimedes]QOC55749.1 hypothetical protein SEA_ARCHIMEDES_49 [Gordonia phage Archimedes]
MSKTDDRRMDKLAAILKQANDVAGTPEELVFREKFAALAAKWGIDSERVIRFVETNDPFAGMGDADHRHLYMQGKYRSMQSALIGSIAQALHSYAVQSGAYRVTLVGMPDHLDRIEALFGLIKDDMLDSAEREGREWRRIYEPGRLRVWRKSYMIGYITRTVEKLVQAEADAAREAGAIVLYKTDEERAKDKMLEVFPDVTIEQKPIGGGLDEIGFMQGAARAEDAGLV